MTRNNNINFTINNKELDPMREVN